MTNHLERKMRIRSIIISLLVMVTVLSSAEAQVRVGFAQPGTMINIPTVSHIIGPDFLRFGFGLELRGFSPFKAAQGIYFDFEPSSKYRFGLTALKGYASSADEEDPAPEFGIHIQRSLFTFENMAVSAGVSDIIFKEETKDASTTGGQPTQILISEISLFSFYGLVSREQEFELYQLRWYIGIGTDRFAADVRTQSSSAVGIFAGFDLKTSFLPQIGGLRILGEYDGSGMNIGTKLPMTRDYSVQVALTHIEKIYKFGDTAQPDAPGINFGLSINFPRKIPEEIVERPTGLPPAALTDLPAGVEGFEGALVPRGYIAPEDVQELRDSLEYAERQVETLNDLAQMLQQRISILKDSVQVVKAERFALEQNINLALKHLSRSLRYYYAGEYRSSLEEVEAAIEFNPNLALAYARRGSIFYKMGDSERAVMNWNMALQLDPEYDDVRNILRAMGENRLRVTSFRR